MKQKVQCDTTKRITLQPDTLKSYVMPIITKRYFSQLVGPICLCILAACSPTTIDSDGHQERSLRMFATTSTAAPKFEILPRDSVFLNPNIRTETAPGLELTKEQLGHIGNQIRKQLQHSHVSIVRTEATAKHIISAHILYGNNFQTKDFIQRFGISPNLYENTDYQKGALILLVYNRAGRIRWRGAVQIYGDADLTAIQSQQRINATVASLIGQIPIITSHSSENPKTHENEGISRSKENKM